MQNKGFIGTIAVLLILICGFYISFSFVANSYEEKADEYAAKIAKTSNPADKMYKQARKEYMDSMANEKVYPLLGYTLGQVKKMEIGMGLDLKGGMNLVLEVPTTDIIRSYAKDEPSLQQIDKAIKAVLPQGEYTTEGVKPSDEDFIKKFAGQFPEGKLTTLFKRDGEFMGKLTGKSSNAEVVAALEKQSEGQVDDAFNVFRNRIDKFGVVSPNLQKLQGKKGQILLELPGVKEPEEMTRILQSSANLEFYEVYNGNEIANEIAQLSQLKAAQDSTSRSLVELLGFQAVASPRIGLVAKGDTAAVNAIINSPEAANILPSNLTLVWENKATEIPVVKNGKEVLKENGEKQTNKYVGLIALQGEPQLEGDAIVSATSEHDNMKGEVVNMRMNDEGASRWSAITKSNLGRSIAIVLDENVYSYPTVNTQITGGSSEITGNFTPEEANDLANLLKSGKMNVKVRVESSQVIGPSLGAQAIESGFTSFVVALVLLMIFMIAFYGFIPGLVANLGLILNLYFTLGILASIQAVLTLSGIAGIVLALGMAVDANVLIFERTKEELRLGKKLPQAIADGYGNAFSAIFDGNLTSIITGVILLLFGSGPIKGFATTLIIGLVCSFFTAVFLTRIVFDLITKNGRNAKMSFTTGISRKMFANTKINFIGKSKGAMIVWLALVVIGVCSLVFRGMNQGIDFSGGRNYVVAFQKDVQPEEIRAKLGKAFQDAATKKGINEPVAVSVITVDNQQKVRVSTNYRINDPSEGVDEDINNILYNSLKEQLTSNGKLMSKEDFALANEEMGIVSVQKVGAAVADDMKTDAMLAVGIAVLCMFLYILLRFRNVAFSVGAVAAVAMTAFLIIGFYSICWGFLPFSMEIDQSFIAAVLTIIGYQINDTVVVFDRVREMLKLNPKEDKKAVFNNSLNATLTRTVMTSVSTLLVLVCIFILGGDTIRSFTFAMIFGVAVGTFCSLFLAAPVAYKILVRKPKAKKNPAAVRPNAGQRLSRG